MNRIKLSVLTKMAFTFARFDLYNNYNGEFDDFSDVVLVGK